MHSKDKVKNFEYNVQKGGNHEKNPCTLSRVV